MATLSEQLKYVPEVSGYFALPQRIVVGGMGGSHLAADLLGDQLGLSNMTVHSDYGLPDISDADLAESSFIAISHSGNTAETLDFARSALATGRPLAVIASGGKLLELAVNEKLPHVAIPAGEEPRNAVGYAARALLSLIGMKGEPDKLSHAADFISASAASMAQAAETIAKAANGRLPLVYASRRNRSLAYYLKVSLNETAKTPAFANVYPELDHNELAGFTEKASAAPFCLISITDDADDVRTKERMEITGSTIADKGAGTANITLEGADRAERVWRFVALAESVARSLASQRGADPDDNSLIEDFKNKLSAQKP